MEGRCVRSFSVLVINSTCVSLSWSLSDNTLVPMYMVVQWSLQRQQGYDPHRGRSSDTWARLPYTERPIYLIGNFLGSEDSGFQLYPVFADGEGEPMYAKATRADLAAYMMLMIISFLSFVLLVTLILSQNQMRKMVWKEVPNPNQCSWAKGLDFKKADTFDLLFRPPEGLSTWPLLLPSENISKVAILDQTDLSAMNTALAQAHCVPLTSDPAPAFSIPLSPEFDTDVDLALPNESEVLLRGASLALNLNTGFSPRIDELLLPDQTSGSNDSSTQSSVTYATVLPSGLKQDGSGSSSSDEGNFSANNSDISESFLGGLWELDNCQVGDIDAPRRSCSYNSVDELSETSDQEDEGEGEVRGNKDLFYPRMDFPVGDKKSLEDEQRREETNIELLNNVVLNREDCAVEVHPLLGPDESSELQSASTHCFSPTYQPQFRTAPCLRQLAAHPQDSKLQP
ncbi:hypothetical protein PBY51_024331 [Eleginops maclovinus]|uniref:Leptin receptor n=1 Tax=Eleginops maclovinus TaxID=56733 RepID=A0AAN7XZN0_ELEMC|nr:hypothetical protein PBY51_024331 [Eleginops maclovinus]